MAEDLTASGARSLNLLKLFPRNEWYELLKEEFEDEYFKKLEDQLYIDYKQLQPSPVRIFKIFRELKPQDVKVVILGQDPYPTPGKATGMAFSVTHGERLPPSLKNIFKEAGIQDPLTGDLSSWVDQGVLLLNSALTVRAREAGSHLEYWEKFTDAAITKISLVRPNLVFMLWGKQSQAKESLILGRGHKILRAAHPSRYSAHRGFFGCGHFEQTKDIIDWKKGIERTNISFSYPVIS